MRCSVYDMTLPCVPFVDLSFLLDAEEALLAACAEACPRGSFECCFDLHS